MKLPRFKLWTLCLAVAAAALVIKLALTGNPVLMFTTPLIFLGPLTGIVVDRQRGGSGATGGVVAGILCGLVLSLYLNVYLVNLGRPFSWRELAVSTAAFLTLEVFGGWFWGRTWHLSMTGRAAVDQEASRA